jgi:membrane-associated progesterone receptor component
MKEFTLEELSRFREGEKIYLALGGKVYDVTKSAMFYGPGGAYHVFAGRDGRLNLLFAKRKT